ncbi:hypothetical protein DFQ28_001720 [Apophysomyces sp. BC1034]|nr:hypothetical protein DFQ30_002439 [Apophysomyces sp. BC1015]KAG0190660.1 hypothetical protein DFQ28_001720 [Apophysomyces sp. BC1034]
MDTRYKRFSLDRRPIEPPPILQMHWLNCSAEDTKYVNKEMWYKVHKLIGDVRKYLQSPFYFMVANLVPASDPTKLLLPSQDYLSGSTVSSLYRLRDIDNTGKLDHPRGVVQNRTTMLSDVFTVFVPKRFPGPLEATFLSRTFSDQGVKMRIRKEHRLQSSTSRKRKLDPTSDVTAVETSSLSSNRPARRKSSMDSHSTLWKEQTSPKKTAQQFTFTNKFRYHYEPRDHEFRQLSPSSLSSDGERTMVSQSFGCSNSPGVWQPPATARPPPPPTRLLDPISAPPSPTLTFTSQFTSSPPSCSAPYDLIHPEHTAAPSSSSSSDGHEYWRLPPLRAIMADVIPCRRSPLLLPSPIPVMHEQHPHWVPHGQVQTQQQGSNTSAMLGMSHIFAAR